MSSDSFEKLMQLIHEQNTACEQHYDQNNRQIMDLLGNLDNNMKNLQMQMDQPRVEHHHNLSKVEEVENEDQEQSQFQVQQEDKEELEQQMNQQQEQEQIIIQDQINEE
ncbi:unnamed protein product (macronuclear) [Paramecium tetraurelia]|uniref:Uncharacterized protein n=1 Tax=Paramecium tetraurelia TaxID=5888 RepID=A0BLS1_PARTE|nr:uncharacterized protein GSPATT00030122001 [Paramecium tetraurelia]CAK59488.1 unnamed protein product [Paramecium tetraurelia]|eukprot:XP_001426886.1 hypothetical protein (macronuclear) [Paramecium tetraurelia strain d4-2]